VGSEIDGSRTVRGGGTGTRKAGGHRSAHQGRMVGMAWEVKGGDSLIHGRESSSQGTVNERGREGR
jgi:hypothetical protein